MGIENRFRQAAYSYILGGGSTVLLTLIFIPASHYRGGVVYIIPGVIFLIVIGCFIYKGYRLLTRIIAILATGRTLLFTLNALLPMPVAVTIPFVDPPRKILLISGTGKSIFLIMAIITGFVAFMLIRAGWWRGQNRP